MHYSQSYSRSAFNICSNYKWTIPNASQCYTLGNFAVYNMSNWNTWSRTVSPCLALVCPLIYSKSSWILQQLVSIYDCIMSCGHIYGITTFVVCQRQIYAQSSFWLPLIHAGPLFQRPANKSQEIIYSTSVIKVLEKLKIVDFFHVSHSVFVC